MRLMLFRALRTPSARRLASLASLLLAALLACRTPAPPRLPDLALAPADDDPPRVALVLGGGGARGLA
jgi:NTE family protein